MRVCYSHHCRQSLTRATRLPLPLPLPLPGYRAWVWGGGGEARWLRITGKSRGAAQGGAHGFWPACPNPLLSPFLTGLSASSLAHSLFPNLLNSVIPRHLQDSLCLLRDCGEAGDKWRGEALVYLCEPLAVAVFTLEPSQRPFIFLFLISSLVSSFPSFHLFF